MTTIHAYKRTKTYVHEFPDVRLVFQPNAAGDVVCDVEKPSAVDRLLQTPTGFKVYEPTPLAIEAMKQAALKEAEKRSVGSLSSSNSERYVLISGTQSLDLRPLSDAQLRAFAKANNVSIPPGSKGDGIRELIVESLGKRGAKTGDGSPVGEDQPPAPPAPAPAPAAPEGGDKE